MINFLCTMAAALTFGGSAHATNALPPLPAPTPDEIATYQTLEGDASKSFIATRIFFRKVKANPNSVTKADMRNVNPDYALDFDEQLLYLQTSVRLGLKSPSA
jgi:hypothetical protein